jgi:CHAD domain-containing protein
VREREVKRALPPETPPLDPDGLLEGLGRWTDDAVDQRATYFDTPDLRLTRAGVSIRFRSDDGWTVKTPVGTDDDAVVRDEHHFPGGPGRPPPEATDLVLAWTRTAPLGEVATVTTRRRRLTVAGDDGATVLEVTDDDVTTEATGRASTAFREIEVEVGPAGTRRALRTVVERLDRLGAEPAPSPSKVARALGDDARRPADAPAATDPADGADLGELVRHALTASLHRLVSYDHRARVGDDPEGVHQARVATRRLRSDLRTFRPVLDRAWAEALRDDLAWIGGELGAVRDADVLLDALSDHLAELPAGDRADAAPLLDRLGRERASRRDALLVALRSTRYLELLDRLVAAAAQPRLADGADHPKRRARKLARHSWRRLRATVRALPSEPSDEQLHEVRKRAKQARYALEAIAPVAAPHSARLARRLATLQDHLGAQHDAIVATEWLRSATAGRENSDVGFAAGMLAQSFLRDAGEMRAGWPDAWRRVRRAARAVF